MTADLKNIKAQALTKFRQQDYQGVLPLLEKISQTEPDNAGAWQMLGICQLRQDDMDAAEKSLRVAVELQPGSLEIRSSLASVLGMTGRFKQAAEIYQYVVEQQPGNFTALLQLGETYYRLEYLKLAESTCLKALQLEPGNIPALMILGKALHDLGKMGAALECFNRVLQQQPGHSGAHERLGWIYHDIGKLDQSIDSYRKALKYSPGRATARLYLGIVLQANGNLEEAITTYRQTIETKPDYVEAYIYLASALRKNNNRDEAVLVYQRALALEPGNADMHLRLGNTLRELGRFEEAADSYSKAIGINPDEAEYPLAMGRLYQAAGENEKALEYLQLCLRLKPDNAAAWNKQGKILYTEGRYIEAISSFRNALRYMPDSANTYVGLAAAQLALNQHEEATHYSAKALDIEPDNTEAIALMAQVAIRRGETERAYSLLQPLLERDNPSDNIIMAFVDVCRDVGRTHDAIQLLEQILENSPDRPRESLINTHFGLGKLYDSEGIFDRAFDHYRQGNDLKQVLFHPQQYMLDVGSFVKLNNWRFMSSLPRASNRSERPVFIVGMPRSGTTLVEQILSSHPEIYGAGELPDIGEIAYSLPGVLGTRKSFPHCLAQATPEMLDKFAAAYLDKLEKLSPDTRYVTDKMLGFMYLGLIELILPAARIIHCVRNPVDTCLSGYFQDFTKHHPYAYNLEHLGIYYQGYQKIMHNWKNVLTLPMLEIQYEELVADQEAVSRRLIEFCGLEWNEKCLRFYENERYVGTASFDQVKRPMYSTSVERWKNYEQFLGPLLEKLDA